jgi:hypothetical protein
MPCSSPILTPSALLISYHSVITPGVLSHREPPTPADPAALSPTPARSMEHERDSLASSEIHRGDVALLLAVADPETGCAPG